MRFIRRKYNRKESVILFFKMFGDKQKPIFEKIREVFDDDHVAEMALLLHHLANNRDRSDDLTILEMIMDSPQVSFLINV